MGIYPEKQDTTPPSVHIEKPQGGLYVFDRKIVPLSSNATVIFGDITIEIVADDHETGIDKAEIRIDGNLKNESKDKHFYWLWNETSIGRHSLTVTAFDNAGNRRDREREVFILNI